MLVSLLSAVTQWKIRHDSYIRLELANYNGGCAHTPGKCSTSAEAYQINRLGIKEFFYINTKCLDEIEFTMETRATKSEGEKEEEANGERRRKIMDKFTQN